jgi:hypothetical protein
MLEVDPTLTADQVRTILRATAVSDVHTGTVPNSDWGFGKLNIYEAVREVAVVFEDGFESGDTGGWSSVTN